MTTRQKTSAELADMIAIWLSAPGVHVAVQPDPVHGWHPIVIGSPAAANKYQQLADELAMDLRRAYELNPGFDPPLLGSFPPLRRGEATDPAQPMI
jgi:hypothetical protein